MLHTDGGGVGAWEFVWGPAHAGHLWHQPVGCEIENEKLDELVLMKKQYRLP